MYVVLFSTKLDKFSFKITADAGKNIPQIVEYGFCKDTISIFCYKDQMCVKEENTVSSSANFVDFLPRPKSA